MQMHTYAINTTVLIASSGAAGVVLLMVLGFVVSALLQGHLERQDSRQHGRPRQDAGSFAQAVELAQMRAAQTMEIPIRRSVPALDGEDDEARTVRERAWRAGLDQAIAEVNERFAVLAAALDEPIVWTDLTAEWDQIELKAVEKMTPEAALEWIQAANAEPVAFSWSTGEYQVVWPAAGRHRTVGGRR